MGRVGTIVRSLVIGVAICLSVTACGKKEASDKKPGIKRETITFFRADEGEAFFSGKEEYAKESSKSVSKSQDFLRYIMLAQIEDDTLYSITVTKSLVIHERSSCIVIPKNVHVILQPGCTLCLESAVCLKGELYCCDGAELSVESNKEGAFLFAENGRVFYNGMEIRNEALPKSGIAYEYGFSTEFSRDSILIQGGAYNNLYFEGDESILSKLSIRWLYDNCNIYVNGENVTKKIEGYGNFAIDLHEYDSKLLLGDQVFSITLKEELLQLLELSSSNTQAEFYVTMTKDITIEDGYVSVPENFHLKIDSGCVLYLGCVMDSYGGISCDTDAIQMNSGALWLCDKGVIQYAETCITCTEREGGDDSYGQGFSVSFPKGMIEFHGGFYSTLFIDNPNLSENELEASWLNTGAIVYVNGNLMK